MTSKRKVPTTEPSRRANVLGSKRAMATHERAMRKLLEAGLRKGPAEMLRLHLELVNLGLADVEARVATLKWYQAIVLDVLNKAGK